MWQWCSELKTPQFKICIFMSQYLNHAYILMIYGIMWICLPRQILKALTSAPFSTKSLTNSKNCHEQPLRSGVCEITDPISISAPCFIYYFAAWRNFNSWSIIEKKEKCRCQCKICLSFNTFELFYWKKPFWLFCKVMHFDSQRSKRKQCKWNHRWKRYRMDVFKTIVQFQH